MADRDPERALNYLVGKVMKAHPAANPVVVRRMLRARLMLQPPPQPGHVVR